MPMDDAEDGDLANMMPVDDASGSDSDEDYAPQQPGESFADYEARVNFPPGFTRPSWPLSDFMILRNNIQTPPAPLLPSEGNDDRSASPMPPVTDNSESSDEWWFRTDVVPLGFRTDVVHEQAQYVASHGVTPAQFRRKGNRAGSLPPPSCGRSGSSGFLYFGGDPSSWWWPTWNPICGILTTEGGHETEGGHS